MSRFYSNHEIKKFDQKLKDLNLIDSNKYKEELKESINKEYHRINVDSAKKKAVIQRMDYDNFHKMVLGADLKGLKSQDIMYVRFDKTEKVVNNCIVKEKLLKGIDVLKDQFVVDVNKNNDKNDYQNKLSQNEVNKDLIIKSNNIKELANILKSKFNSISQENIELKFNVLIEADNKIQINNFIKLNEPVEPKLFCDILYCLIYTINDMINENNKNNNKELNFKNINMIDELIESLISLNNIKKIKLFVKKDVKYLIKNMLESIEYSELILLVKKIDHLIN